MDGTKTTGLHVLAVVISGGMLLASAGPQALADGTLTGNCWIEKVKGRSGNYLSLYEWNIHCVVDGGSVAGKSYRVGLPPNPQSYYTFTMPGGIYSLFLDQPLFWGRPKAVSNVVIPGSGSTSLDLDLPTDYSCAFGGNSGEWGADPWTSWAPVWYQTFIATGTSVTGVQFKLAGTNARDMLVSVHADNGGNITTWPQVGVSRLKANIGATADMWVRFRSGMIPTTPAQRYALKLTGQNGTPNNDYAIYRRIEDGQGYADGQAYNAAGQAQSFDLYAVIFSDNDGTLVPYCVQESDAGSLAGWDNVWTQQIKAMGHGLAGATLFFAGGNTWDKEFTFRVRSGSVNGPQVGPAKTGRGAFQASTSGHVAASWSPSEVALTPGVVYYLEVYQSYGFNPYKMTKSVNAYPDGYAFKNGSPQTGVDLHMQVVEWADEPAPPEPVEEDFETMPVWSSSYDAAWGSAATWSIVSGGQAGNALQVGRSSGGSSVKARIYAVAANTDYTLTIYSRCPSYSGTYWAECAYKLGYSTAEDFDSSPAGWTVIKKFSNDSDNGNGNVWTQYTKTFNSGSVTQITVAYKLGSYGGAGPNVAWDMLRITPPGVEVPEITLNPTSLTPSTWQGSSPAADSVTIQNTGEGTLEYTITDNASWLSCTPTSGTSTGEADTITVNYSTASLTPGTYYATITASDPEASNNPQTIAVSLTVVQRPVITLNPTSLSPVTNEGSSPPAGSFTVQNTGGSMLEYTISDNVTWLSCTPTSGTSTGEADTITVNYSTASLTPGTYYATITVSDPEASNNPQTIAVSLTVNEVKLTVAEDFSSMPSWSSSWDAAWGSAATWSIVSGGESGNCLRASRSSQGSSAKVKVYNITAGKNYTVSIYMKCPSHGGSYWMECAYRLGNWSAQNFDESGGSWTMIQKFADGGPNGNGNTWVQYSATFNSGSNTQISVGYKLGSWGGGGPTVYWDTLRVQ